LNTVFNPAPLAAVNACIDASPGKRSVIKLVNLWNSITLQTKSLNMRLFVFVYLGLQQTMTKAADCSKENL
jgi:hypothetical protein